ncbi:U-box domain-containing protein 3 [Nicotiana sylvestris]|uniref:U-box domain-containing protein 4 n=1 Tax=Nicotiana sylvestris TaxID=4096 RepID=A0A1U7X7S1_NICSY|nr:PREDICTED: U-box domain-containing protein 4 [Nicotiana sylvestris]
MVREEPLMEEKCNEEEIKRNKKNKNIIEEIAERLRGEVEEKEKIEAAKEIRKLVRRSSSSGKTRSRFAAAGVIPPLVDMLQLSSSSLLAREAALLALLNLASRNERNKIRIVTCGAIPPLVELLKFQNGNLKELATAAILTLSAAATNKPTIAASGVGPLLVQILSSGTVQGRVDAVTALHNLSTTKEDPKLVLDARAVFPLMNLLKDCKKYSKFAEKTTALLEILSNSEEGRDAITNAHNGILTLVETVEDGSLVSTEHAVGALLSLCQSSRDKYRELILKEGAIPGLLRLTAEGTPQAQERARTLLDLLRDSPPENKFSSSMLERIVYDFAAQVNGNDKAAETAKRLLQDMVHRSMELSMSRLQLRASSCTPSKVQSV